MQTATTTTQLGPCSSSVASGSSYKFTGEERDSESGLDNFEARYLGSSLGRFMSLTTALTDQMTEPTRVTRENLIDSLRLALPGFEIKSEFAEDELGYPIFNDLARYVCDQARLGDFDEVRNALSFLELSLEGGNAYIHDLVVECLSVSFASKITFPIFISISVRSLAPLSNGTRGMNPNSGRLSGSIPSMQQKSALDVIRG